MATVIVGGSGRVPHADLNASRLAGAFVRRRQKAILETLTSIKRAGADMVLTCRANEFCEEGLPHG